MDGKLKKHITKILKALGLLKKWKYEPESQKVISNSEFLLQAIESSFHPEKNLDEDQIEAADLSLNKLKTDIFGGNKEIIDSINRVMIFFEQQTKDFFKR